ncbi:uncharacterized protein BDZ99DRAFT_76514 [Mytilinidion resinicola]|uniref:Uncharacterized protein n=1 Tax=Mytilinidion resinicola TaxID=574789 RepID=A0A6A6YFB3_9PEZI|nr:uncharacterized protein BDZ99DRAFT_76514 [Mytilinidion resinicola]KAF2807223.1 hypothetical protein BDZ99DRAFT_76514 [Mytilinidion resinicola]
MGCGQASGIPFFICLAVIIHPCPSVHSRVLLPPCIFIGAEYRSLASGSAPPHNHVTAIVPGAKSTPKPHSSIPQSQSSDAKSLNQKSLYQAAPWAKNAVILPIAVASLVFFRGMRAYVAFEWNELVWFSPSVWLRCVVRFCDTSEDL